MGGAIGGGKQYVSWIHEADFLRAVDFIMGREDLRGAINVCAPEPLPQKNFMRELRKAWGVPIGLPAAAWMAEIGASDSKMKRLSDIGFVQNLNALIARVQIFL